ncbi:AarF/ABC1/UbiB kinase family protein [Pseudomonas sp. SK3(2021)]|uniref:ABC1 kinase family protein n=1 Tax=Pseudomonas sp. SK3(2021) TaxID=2841064 RepID=UPI00192BA744|nr:AarF/UbiB family protein [Pseudomonas sp. SK3(2021)]QQZ39463.1 AarF/ABC1/UbiB kinase family protein [Pseudomonas sp. SK3(2021)]
MSSLKRLLQITFTIGGYLFWWLLVRLHLRRTAITPAQQLRGTLERLGTAFVKLGQGLSLHRDLLSEEYIQELQCLQDRVAPFANDVAAREVENALGRPIAELFAEFESQPLAAASIAQVHKAQMPDGRRVVVKIRRPHIKAEIDRDMRLLRGVMRVLLTLSPWLRRYEPLAIIDEIWSNLRKETDFRKEAHQITHFVEAFRDSDTVYVPALIDGLYCESVLVQEMSSGRRVDDPTIGEQGPRLAQAFVEAYLQQVFVMGVFHGDPHPGNLFVMASGTLCFHDFGIVGVLSPRTRRHLAAFLLAFVHQDGEWLLDAAVELGLLEGDLKRDEFRQGLQEIIEEYAELPLKEWSLAEVFLRVARLGEGRHVRLPHNLLVLMRAMALMENAVRSLDPEFNLLGGLLAKAEAVLKATAGAGAETGWNRLRFEMASGAQELPAEFGALIHRLRANGLEIRLQHHGMEHLEGHIDRASNRMALALVTLGLYIAASLLMLNSIGPRLGDIPLLAAAGYALALWFTLRLARGISRSGRL